MKFYKFMTIIGVAAMGISLASCDDDYDYTPAPVENIAGVYFPTEQVTEFVIDKDMTTVNATLSRMDNNGTQTVGLIPSGDTGYFSIPEGVTFADGESTVEIPVTITKEGMVKLQTYHFNISLSDELSTNYMNVVWEGIFVYGREWETIGMAEYTDDFWASIMGGVQITTYDVEVQEHAERPGYFRLVNPYGEAFPYYSYGTAIDGDHYMYINAEDPERVYIETCETGWGYSNYGELICSSAVYEYMLDPDFFTGSPTLDQLYQAGYYGTLEDGIITFNPTTLCVTFENLDGWYTANSNGAFCVDMSSLLK